MSRRRGVDGVNPWIIISCYKFWEAENSELIIYLFIYYLLCLRWLYSFCLFFLLTSASSPLGCLHLPLFFSVCLWLSVPLSLDSLRCFGWAAKKLRYTCQKSSSAASSQTGAQRGRDACTHCKNTHTCTHTHTYLRLCQCHKDFLMKPPHRFTGETNTQWNNEFIGSHTHNCKGNGRTSEVLNQTGVMTFSMLSPHCSPLKWKTQTIYCSLKSLFHSWNCEYADHTFC